MGFDDQPDKISGGKSERTDGSGGEVDTEIDGAAAGEEALYIDNDQSISKVAGEDGAPEYIAGTEATRLHDGQQDVSSTDADTNALAESGVGERTFKSKPEGVERAGHGAEFGMLGNDGGLEDVLETGELRDAQLSRSAEHLVRGTFAGDESLFKDDHVAGKREDLGAIVGDVDDGNVVFGIPKFEVFDDVRLGAGIECGERLVEKKIAGRRSKSTGESNSLALTAGDAGGTTIREVRHSETREQIKGKGAAFGGTSLPDSVEDVVEGGHVREESQLLEEVSGPAVARRNIDVLRCVEKDAAVHGDGTGLGCDESGESVEERGLAGTGGAEEDSDTGCKREADVESEVRQRDADGGLEDGGQCVSFKFQVDRKHAASRQKQQQRQIQKENLNEYPVDHTSPPCRELRATRVGHEASKDSFEERLPRKSRRNAAGEGHHRAIHDAITSC